MTRYLFALAALGGSALALGQQGTLSPTGGKLVNLDTAAVPAANTSLFRADFRGFGGDEKTGYGTAELSFGLQQGWGAIIRGSFAGFRTFHGPGFDIRHGGTDIEGLVRYAVPTIPNLTIAAGASIPNTPAQDSPFLTSEIIYGIPNQGVDLYIGAKGVFRRDSTIAAVAGGFNAHLAEGFSVVGDITLPFTGRNTYSTSTGANQRRAIYGAALRYMPTTTTREQWSIDLGVTNGTGGTTGFSLTPALGNSVGVFAAATVRF